MTTNIPIIENEPYKLITMSIMTNRGAYDLEFLVSVGIPDEGTLGHILKSGEGVSSEELPAGDIYVRSTYKDAVLVISE